MKERKGKPVRLSTVEEKFPVCRHQLNPMNIMHGGELVKIVDEVAGRAAAKHTNKVCVTASIDSLHFLGPIFLYETIVVKATVNRAWHTSMEVGTKVFVEGIDPSTGTEKVVRHVSSAFLTFVALGADRKPTEISPVIPEITEEKRRYREANRRRKIRLASRPKTPNP